MKPLLIRIAAAVAAGPLGRFGEALAQHRPRRFAALQAEPDAGLREAHAAQADLVAARALNRGLREKPSASSGATMFLFIGPAAATARTAPILGALHARIAAAVAPACTFAAAVAALPPFHEPDRP